MYNLLMWSGYDGDSGAFIIPKDRFLLYTDQALKDNLEPMGDSAIDDIRKYPALFTSEFPSKTPARVAWIAKIKDQKALWRIEFDANNPIALINSDDLEKIFLELDIQRAERGTTHWAVKDVDLLAVLRKKGLWRGYPVDPDQVEFSRRTIVKACDLLARYLNHSDLDQLLQELAMEHTPAAIRKGGLKVRCTDLSGYAIACPKERTAEGTPLAYALVERAAQVYTTKAANSIWDTSEIPELHAFRDALEKEGLSVSAGRLFRVSEGSMPASPPAPVLPAFPAHAATATGAPQAIPSGGTVMSLQPSVKPKVFIVHGRDDAAKHEVARFLERIGLEAVILHEQANGGRTLITKFQEVAKDVSFAVVLMTPDDEGGLTGATARPRPRQNVVFELGFFLGRMDPSRVCALVKGEVEKPSDFDGIVYIHLDSGGGWRGQLMRELQHAGIPFDAQKGLY